MTFLTALFLGIAAFSAGGSFSSTMCILAGKIFRKKVLKTRLAVVFILLAVAVLCLAVQILFVRTDFFNADFLFLGASFVTGALCVCFWKTVLPVFVFIYICISAATGIYLYNRFGARPESFSATVYKDSVKAEGTSYYADTVENKSFLVEFYRLPATLLIPVPRIWYKTEGIINSSVEEKIISKAGRKSDFTPYTESSFIGFSDSRLNENNTLSKNRKFEGYINWILGEKSYMFIKIPEAEFYPFSMTINFTQKNEVLSYEVVH